MNKASQCKKELIFVFGRLCSGKGTYCNRYKSSHHIICTSSVVKKLSGKTKRSDLVKTSYLDEIIADELIREISQHDKVVVEGIRQLTIVRKIQVMISLEYEVKYVWLDVPKDTLESRFYSRSDKKDDVDFETAYQQDEQLGISELEKWVNNRVNPFIIKN